MTGSVLSEYVASELLSMLRLLKQKINVHQYSSGKEVIKAFLPGDWVFKNDKGLVIKVNPLDGITNRPKQLKIAFRIKKNRQNGQSKTIM